jgi:hypothetical protein
MSNDVAHKIKKLSQLWGVSIDEVKNKIISNLEWIKDDKLFNHILDQHKKENTSKK